MNIIEQKELSLIEEFSDYELQLLVHDEDHAIYVLEYYGFYCFLELHKSFNIIRFCLLKSKDSSRKEKVLLLINDFNKKHDLFTLYLDDELILLRQQLFTDNMKQALDIIYLALLLGDLRDWFTRLKDVI